MLIDAHSHIYPPSYLAFLRSLDQPPHLVTRDGVERFVMYAGQAASPQAKGARVTREFSGIDAKLEYMQQYGVDRSILSLGNPWFDFLPAREGAGWAARINAELAEMCAQNPDRFWYLACLPTGDVQAAVQELRRLKRGGTAAGVLMGTRLGGGWVDEAAAAPFWACLEEVQLPVFLHPFHAPAGDDLAEFDDMLRFSLAFPFETAVAASRLILSGTLDRFPGVKIVLAHAGGALPGLISRVEAYSSKGQKEKLRAPVTAYLQRFYFDAIAYAPEPLRMVASLAGCDRLIFGSDHPFAAAHPQRLNEILRQAGLSEAEQAQVTHQTASALFNPMGKVSTGPSPLAPQG